MLIIIFLSIVTLLTTILIFSKLYVKTPPNMAFIRTGLGGKRVVIDRGAVVFPLVQNIQWVSLETFKLEVFKSNREAFITKDRFRVDIGADFYVKVEPLEDSVERASRSLGERGLSVAGIKALIEEKLISALRSEAAKMTLVELHENRRGFARAVMENLKEALIPNGLTLEDVSIFYLDQTDKKQLDPNNVFDAEGLRQITMQTSERMRERNEIERNTEVAIKRKDVEAVKLKLALDQERSFAESEQIRQVEMDRARKMAEVEIYKYEQEKVAKEAEVEKERALKEAQIRRETLLLEQTKHRELKEVEKRKAVEEAEKERAIALIVKDMEILKEESRKLELEAMKELALQKVITSQEKAKAERMREISLIDAIKELEVAEKKLRIAELTSEAKRIEGESEALVLEKIKRAENILDEKIINRDIALELIARSPDIIKELMSPAKQIESIKVIHLDGLKGDDALHSPVDGILGAIIRVGAALPLLKELLNFTKIDAEALKKLLSEMPVVKEVKRS